MSALVPTNVQLPAHLTNRVGTSSAIGSAMTSGIASGGTGFKRISIRGGRFRIREGAEETVLPDSVLRAVIVGAAPRDGVYKSFYKGAYNPKAAGEDNKPDCYSSDGVRPAKDAIDPQAQQCATCPQNAWGSKVTDAGTKMKACADQKKLAIISADDHSSDPTIYQFTVTPAALTNFRQYGELLSSKGLPPELCITEISFDPKEAYPKAQFKFGGFVSEGQVELIDKLVGSDRVREVVGDKAQAAMVVETKPKKPAITVKEEPKYVAPPVVIEDAEYEDITPVQASKPTKGFGGSPSPAKEPEPAPVVKASNLTMDVQAILASMEEVDD